MSIRPPSMIGAVLVTLALGSGAVVASGGAGGGGDDGEVTLPVSIERPAGSPAPATRLAVPAQDPPPQDPPVADPVRRVVGYYSSWSIYERGVEVADIDAESLTHVNYAFANLVDGRCVLGDPWADVRRPRAGDDPDLPYRGNFNQLQVLKERHPHLRTLISVGGSTWSTNFSAAAATAAGRTTLAASCVDLMSRYGFDGIDVDWEFPAAADRHHYTALLVEIRRQLDATGPVGGARPLLTIAASAGAPNMANLDIPAIVATVDWVNVMTYDFAGAWSPGTGHNSPLYDYPGIEDPSFSVDSGLRRWVQAGAPADRLVAGLAFYGRGFGGVTSEAPGAPFSSLPMGTTEPGQFDYADLANRALAGMAIRFDEAARVPYAFDPGSGVWISFDDPRSIEEKARYVDRNGYGGVMVWELSNDRDGELLAAARRGLGG